MNVEQRRYNLEEAREILLDPESDLILDNFYCPEMELDEDIADDISNSQMEKLHKKEFQEQCREQWGVDIVGDMRKSKVKQLKEMCLNKGLPISGTKQTLIKRLTDPPRPLEEITNKESFSINDVHAILSSLEIDNATEVNPCLKQGIRKKYVRMDIPDPLNQILIEDGCIYCDTKITVKVKDILYQKTYGGNDYEDAGIEASVKCPNSDGGCFGGIYITRVCHGDPKFDSGKFHNHCTVCKGFGICIGDYREDHCRQCNNHYWATGDCDTCYPEYHGSQCNCDVCYFMANSVPIFL